jgi:hypothetical protein
MHADVGYMPGIKVVSGSLSVPPLLDLSASGVTCPPLADKSVRVSTCDIESECMVGTIF